MGASQSADKEQYGFHVLKVAYIIIKYGICFCFNPLYVLLCTGKTEFTCFSRGNGGIL
jgi:hypothetical protein